MSRIQKILEEIEKHKHIVEIFGREVYFVPLEAVKQIIRKHMDDDWIQVEERTPEKPKENPAFDDKPLELYLVDIGESYSLRAFWNGKQFTDGWSVLNVIAWQPLPEPYQTEK